MEFAVDDSQRMIADTVRRLLDSRNPFEARRARLMARAPDRRALWASLAEAGVVGGLFPEISGGFGGTARDAAVLLYEVGRSLAVEPVTASLICGRLLLAARSVRAQGEIDALISGERILAFAHCEGYDPFAPPALLAEADGEGYRLTGRKMVVRNADVADAFVTTASIGTGGNEAIFLVETAAAGLSVELHRLIDAAGGGQLRFDRARATLLLAGAPARDATIDAIEHGIVANAAEAVGMLDALNGATRDFLNTRHQFGQPLARFQALQHRAADMHIASEEVAVAVDGLLDAMSAPVSAERSARVSALKVLVDRAGRRVAHEAVQLHGGMGVSDELPVSHYLRRFAAMAAEHGGADVHLRRVVQLAPDGIARDEPDDIAAFRQEVRDFIRARLPDDLRRKARHGLFLERDDYQRWERILRAKGWFAAAWPAEHGGADWSLGQQLTFIQEAALNDAPPIIPYGVNMLGPVIYTFGTPEQKIQYLPDILSSAAWWCQGYSEPNAGSDLASLKTFAERDGDHYVVNGTKLWTTEAQWADMMHCLVRTRREGKPQAGITFLLIDMTTPGLTIQPILTLDGQHHTNQIFFDNVRVPMANVVGGEGQGWAIAKFLLANERVAIADTGAKLRLVQQIRALLASARAEGGMAADTASRMIDRIADLDIQLSALVALERRYVEAWSAGASRAGPEASLLKIRGTEILQALTALALDIEGPMAAFHDPAHLHLAPETSFSAVERASFVANHYLYSRCWSIFGGTNEIQRNIVSKAIGVG